MSRHKVEICGVNTANIKVLTNEEMTELFVRYQSGDESAKEELINGNLKLVLSILKSFSNRTDNLDDLFQVGVIGLIKAIDNFDLSYNLKLSTYACPMIIGEIKRVLRDNNSVRIARSIKDVAYKALRMKEQLTNEMGREPSVDLIASKLELPIYDVTNALDSMRDTISMFEPIYNDGGDVIYLSDQIQDNKNEMFNLDVKLALKEAISKLKSKEKYIINARYFVGKTQMELADEIGISQAQISRLEKSGLDNIKKIMEN